MILRYEDAVALKHRINFYKTDGADIRITRIGNGRCVIGIIYGRRPLKGNRTLYEIIND